MGIRPSMYFLCGIDDLKTEGYQIVDERYTSILFNWQGLVPPLPTWEPPEEIRKWRKWTVWNDSIKHGYIKSVLQREDKPRKEGYELLSWDSEFGPPNVIGYVIDELPYANDCLYAFAIMDKRFNESGYFVLPSVPLDEDTSQDAQALKVISRLFKLGKPLPHDLRKYVRGANGKKRRICANQNYPTFGIYMDGYIDITLYLFDWIGLNVHRNDLKLMLYWRWS